MFWAVRVLVIDDSMAVRRQLVNGLAGCVVETAGDGADGAVRAEKGAFDVLLVDDQLGDVTGPALVKRLADKGIRTPVVMLAERNAEAARRACAGLDTVVDVLAKPVLPAAVLAVVHRVAASGSDTTSGVPIGGAAGGAGAAGASPAGAGAGVPAPTTDEVRLWARRLFAELGEGLARMPDAAAQWSALSEADRSRTSASAWFGTRLLTEALCTKVATWAAGRAGRPGDGAAAGADGPLIGSAEAPVLVAGAGAGEVAAAIAKSGAAGAGSRLSGAPACKAVEDLAGAPDAAKRERAGLVVVLPSESGAAGEAVKELARWRAAGQRDPVLVAVRASQSGRSGAAAGGAGATGRTWPDPSPDPGGAWAKAGWDAVLCRPFPLPALSAWLGRPAARPPSGPAAKDGTGARGG